MGVLGSRRGPGNNLFLMHRPLPIQERGKGGFQEHCLCELAVRSVESIGGLECRFKRVTEMDCFGHGVCLKSY